jgi:hypothetical protein
MSRLSLRRNGTVCISGCTYEGEGSGLPSRRFVSLSLSFHVCACVCVCVCVCVVCVVTSEFCGGSTFCLRATFVPTLTTRPLGFVDNIQIPYRVQSIRLT